MTTCSHHVHHPNTCTEAPHHYGTYNHPGENDVPLNHATWPQACKLQRNRHLHYITYTCSGVGYSGVIVMMYFIGKPMSTRTYYMYFINHIVFLQNGLTYY